jgi:ribonuclease P protein component
MGASGSVRDQGALPAQFVPQIVPMERLKRRTDFRAAATGARAPGRAFVLQARRRADEGPVRVGFTVSKQVGNAVERNRVRRRLREMVRLAAAGQLHGGHDYVLIGRRAALQAPFGDMMRELDAALSRIHASGRGATGGALKGTLHETGSPAASRRKPSQNAPS